MSWILYIVGGIAVAFALLFLFGLLHLRQSRLRAENQICQINLDEIESLVRECVAVFHSKWGVTLNLDNLQETAEKLDDAFRDKYRLKGAFERPDFYWYFVKPVGAYLGDLLRRHTGHTWQKEAGSAPFMVRELQGGSSTVFPFEKVIKHVQTGESGDLVAYVTFAMTIDDDATRPSPE